MGDVTSAELIKLIQVELRPGHREPFLHSQAVWNRETATSPGYLGEVVGDVGKDELYVITFWSSRAAYERWMETEHDRIANLAGSQEHYATVEVRLVDTVTDG